MRKKICLHLVVKVKNLATIRDVLSAALDSLPPPVYI